MKRFFALSLAAVALAGFNQTSFRSLKCKAPPPYASSSAYSSSLIYTIDQEGWTYDWDSDTNSWLPTPITEEFDDRFSKYQSEIVDNVFRIENGNYRYEEPDEPYLKEFVEVDLKKMTYKWEISGYRESKMQGTCEWVETFTSGYGEKPQSAAAQPPASNARVRSWGFLLPTHLGDRTH